ncbi:TetR/AcrR family transcriptional regulator [Planctobacterium marinum]|uniref:TetR family transcriptional regulator n=1 Tax=Planctobacterium marinum TaxID=1631968 RepID=A0AA48HNQ0_9ALTE|nr:TetR family transcriptional regulator [Planctobacterium marinum]
MNKKQQLLKLAEEKVRKGGYNNFSFRELANEAGIKSASVHYHFATKADLGAELAASYTDKFISALGEPDSSAGNPVSRFVDAFRSALNIDQQMCLCGLFGAESAGLPEKVQRETQLFFERNICWLTHAFMNLSQLDEVIAKQEAVKLLALLEGAMLMSNTMKDNSLFELAIEEFVEQKIQSPSS